MTLATTTSTRDSGLLDVLVPLFEAEAGISVKVVAVGSGQALELGRRRDADVLLTHAPEAEERFMKEGHGKTRYGVMHNDFVLVGPLDDPAETKNQDSIIAALGVIARNEARFVSRGDESGTHMKERAIWQMAGLLPQRKWYIESGSGMAETLRIANEKHAYTLADRGTFLAQQPRLDLTITSKGDPVLRNPYSVIVVNPEGHPALNVEAAQSFANFLLSAKVQQVIEQFGVERHKQPMFFPLSATPKESAASFANQDEHK